MIAEERERGGGGGVRGGSPYPHVKTLLPLVREHRVGVELHRDFSRALIARLQEMRRHQRRRRQRQRSHPSASPDAAAPERRGDHLDVGSRHDLKQNREGGSETRRAREESRFSTRRRRF
ncbi:hypothetical protein B296_00026400 [Ensete ventricosum]|uniref:Uncharacterized protein n=1 Tax=Ensete ventricosum TaxID=4639 RepID=A0A426YBU0_ENSVE|nr:hypothetical protein B296_00026400 [Ensete ventricosum]